MLGRSKTRFITPTMQGDQAHGWSADPLLVWDKCSYNSVAFSDKPGTSFHYSRETHHVFLGEIQKPHQKCSKMQLCGRKAYNDQDGKVLLYLFDQSSCAGGT